MGIMAADGTTPKTVYVHKAKLAKLVPKLFHRKKIRRAFELPQPPKKKARQQQEQGASRSPSKLQDYMQQKIKSAKGDPAEAPESWRQKPPHPWTVK